MTDEHRDAAELIREAFYAEGNQFELPPPAVVEVAASPFSDPPGWEMADCDKCGGSGWIISSRDGHNWMGCPKCLRGGQEYESLPAIDEAARSKWKRERAKARAASREANRARARGSTAGDRDADC